MKIPPSQSPPSLYLPARDGKRTHDERPRGFARGRSSWVRFPSLVFEPLGSSGNQTQERNEDTGSNDGNDDASNQTKVGVGNEEVGK